MNIRLVVSDDHASVREGLRVMLGNQPGMEEVGTARDGRESIQLMIESALAHRPCGRRIAYGSSACR